MFSPRPFSHVVLGFAALALLSLAGCAEDDLASPDDYTAPVVSIEMAPVAPPPSSDEIRPEINNPRLYVWRAGHWVYEDERFTWIPGEVLTRPSPTAVWSADQWQRREYGWVFIHGYWQ